MISKLRGFLRNIGIRTRLVFGFICVPLCFMIIFFLLYYNFSVNVILDKNEESSKQLVRISEEIFHLSRDKLSEDMEKLSREPYVKAFMQSYNDVNVKTRFINKLHKSPYLASRSGLQFYDVSGTSIYKEGRVKNLDITKYKKRVDDATKTLWVSDEETQAVLMLHSVYDNEQQLIGYVSSEIDVNAFNPAFARNMNQKTMLLIVGTHNEYIFGTADMKRGEILHFKHGKIKLGTGSYFYVAQEITGMDWKVVNLVSEDYILEEIHNFLNMLLVYGFAFLFVLLIVSTLVYHSIYDPMHRILKSMRSLDETDLSSNQVEDYGKDELHELSCNFNELLSRVEELLHTVEVEQEQKRVTQFQLLQAQINPHFLFNTLNTLHYLAILNEDKPVSEGITALAKLLRNTIVDSKETVCLEEEIENVKNYIIIQKLRFGDLFETVYNIDDDVKDAQILKFLLQPIVENSTLHAFEEDKEYQVLTIRAKAEGIYLKIEIGDNGKGFNSKQSKHSKLSGIGMNNIAERIRLMYGENYRMEVTSVLHKGTIITLWLPLVKGNKEHV